MNRITGYVGHSTLGHIEAGALGHDDAIRVRIVQCLMYFPRKLVPAFRLR